MPSQPLQASVTLAAPVDLHLSLAPLKRGPADPCTRFTVGGVWRAIWTPQGPASIYMETSPLEATVSAKAWGPGAGWALETFPSVIGADDDQRPFRSMLERRCVLSRGGSERLRAHEVVKSLAHRVRGLRIGRTLSVTEAAIPSVLEQKVIIKEAHRSYRQLVRSLGERAPGPAGAAGMLVPPRNDRLAATPYWLMHRFGVERKRAETLRRVASHARRLEETVRMCPADAARRLKAIPGVGPWTAAEVGLVSLGDADAVSVGDFHLPHYIIWALAGRARGTDAEMLELLEPYRGQRARVIRLVLAGAAAPPRYGPGLALNSIWWR